MQTVLTGLGWLTLVIKVPVAFIVFAVILPAESLIDVSEAVLAPSGQQESAVEMKSERELQPIVQHRAA